ncbi:MAG: hypothetical protein ACFFD4_13975 [Candidatus Odinarchaeota archaeon]
MDPVRVNARTIDKYARASPEVIRRILEQYGAEEFRKEKYFSRELLGDELGMENRRLREVTGLLATLFQTVNRLAEMGSDGILEQIIKNPRLATIQEDITRNGCHIPGMISLDKLG